MARKVIGGLVVFSPVIAVLIWAGIITWWIPLVIIGGAGIIAILVFTGLRIVGGVNVKSK